MNIQYLCLLLLNTELLTVNNVQLDEDTIGLLVESTAQHAVCPSCGEQSNRIHSTYVRYPVDLAWAAWRIVLHLKVKRFFCLNAACAKRTFAEPFPGLVARYARCTERVRRRQQLVGANVPARTAEPLLTLAQIGLSDTTINRLVRALPDPACAPVRVLGVDDWAKRKGQQYGTLLINLERGQVVDILPDRSADTLAQWLQEHPEIEIVSRDRSTTYAEGITQGAPQAVQVADRWHLLKNQSEAVTRVLQREYAEIRRTWREKRQGAPAKVADPTSSPAAQQRAMRIAVAQRLSQQGWTQRQIAQQLDVHPKTVRRYLNSSVSASGRQQRRSLLDPFKPYLIQRWQAGCHNATQLFREIKQRGFQGKPTIVRDFIRKLRNADPSNGAASSVRLPSPRALTCALFSQVESSSDETQQIWEHIRQEHPRCAATWELARGFAALIREQQADALDKWLDQAEQSEDRIWRNFAASLRKDLAAVRAALVLPWSNGPTEGHVNRLKCLKRQMYGRAKDDLLRKRVLWQGRWAFT